MIRTFFPWEIASLNAYEAFRQIAEARQVWEEEHRGPEPDLRSMEKELEQFRMEFLLEKEKLSSSDWKGYWEEWKIIKKALYFSLNMEFAKNCKESNGRSLYGGLVRIPGTKKGIAVATECNSRDTYLNPYEGAKMAVCESAQNVFAAGASRNGVTNNLNFGNPYIPENYYVFSECVRELGASFVVGQKKRFRKRNPIHFPKSWFGFFLFR